MKGKTGHVHIFALNKDYIKKSKKWSAYIFLTKSGWENDNKKTRSVQSSFYSAKHMPVCRIIQHIYSNITVQTVTEGEYKNPKDLLIEGQVSAIYNSYSSDLKSLPIMSPNQKATTYFFYYIRQKDRYDSHVSVTQYEMHFHTDSAS